jgi:putative transposase
LAAGHDLYDRLGRTHAERQIGYRALFRDALDAGFIDELRAATNGGWALGDARFKREIAKALGRRVAPLPRGRRPKPKTPARQPSRL